MGVKFISPDELGAEIAKIISEYTEDVSQAIENEIDSTAKEVRKEVRAMAPRNRPEYYKGFSIRTDRSRGQVSKIIYNKTYPGLVHLLELGHAKRGGKGRVDERPHLRPAYDKHVPAMEKRIEDIIKNGG